MVTAHAERGFDHARLRAVTTAHSRDVTLKLQELVGKGLLVATGSARARTHMLASDAQHPARAVSSEEGGTGSEETGAGSEESSEETDANSEETDAGSEESSEETDADSDETGSGARGWAPREHLLEALLAFCAGT